MVCVFPCTRLPCGFEGPETGRTFLNQIEFEETKHPVYPNEGSVFWLLTLWHEAFHGKGAHWVYSSSDSQLDGTPPEVGGGLQLPTSLAARGTGGTFQMMLL